MDELEGGAKGRKYFVKVKETGVRLVYTFQDRTDMYMVMEYCENGDLLKVTSELQQVPEEERVMRECGIFWIDDLSIRLPSLQWSNTLGYQTSEYICYFGLARDIAGDNYMKEDGTNRSLNVQEI
ncbi:MAG: hypothetical protein EZS28_031933 [Streblomastix strix]|uniref:Protein kinase domain-containing protein n=1 Tax=Streblomastix strix TaxID=222440 RepID=A0A5J4UR61_9EUKA|nr:MAG: hypothetical protein EZS28_031933 [Streblomastix strix]